MEQSERTIVVVGDGASEAALLRDVAELRAALWVCYAAAGGDPRDYVDDAISNAQLIALVLDCVQDLRGLFDAARRDLR